MSDPTRWQVSRAARVVGLQPARARAFLAALELVQELDGTRGELVKAQRELVRASGATSPIPNTDRRHTFIAAEGGPLVLQVGAGEVIEGNGPAQAFASPGTYTLPEGQTCVWVHGPERSVPDLGVPDRELPDLTEYDVESCPGCGHERQVLTECRICHAPARPEPEQELGEHPELHSGLCSDGSGRCSRCLQQLTTQDLQAGTGVEPTCQFAPVQQQVPPVLQELAEQAGGPHTRVRRSMSDTNTWCRECNLGWLADEHRERLQLSGVDLDAIAVTTEVPARA